MIYPSIEEITKGQYNRYSLVIATAKCARKILDEELMNAKEKAAEKEERHSKKDAAEEKSVKKAIRMLTSGEMQVVSK